MSRLCIINLSYLNIYLMLNSIDLCHSRSLCPYLFKKKRTWRVDYESPKIIMHFFFEICWFRASKIGSYIQVVYHTYNMGVSPIVKGCSTTVSCRHIFLHGFIWRCASYKYDAIQYSIS